MLLRLIEKEGIPMMSIKHSVFCASLVAVAACGRAERDFDVRAFIPKPVATPAVALAGTDQVATPVTPVTPASPASPALAVFVAPTRFDDAMLQGKASLEKGDRAKATLMFEAAMQLDKKRAEPHLELAKLYIANGERGLAMAAANKAIKLAPLSSQAWNTKGRAELNRFAYDDAIEAFTKAVELDKDNVWAWNNLGYTELQLKKYEEAATHLGEAVTKRGATGYMFNNLGTALEHLDRLDEARTAFEGGARLGSKASVASRKRLEGVTSIAIIEQAIKPDIRPDANHTYDTNEGPSELDPALDDAELDPAQPEVSKATAEGRQVEAPVDAGVPTM
jgi:tetratricopeptide (TPR) repeat protein